MFQLSSSTSNPKELFPTSSSRSLEPTVSKFSETCFLLGRDYGTVLVEEAKDNIEIRNTIKWEAPPLSVGEINISTPIIQNLQLPILFIQSLQNIFMLIDNQSLKA